MKVSIFIAKTEPPPLTLNYSFERSLAGNMLTLPRPTLPRASLNSIR